MGYLSMEGVHRTVLCPREQVPDRVCTRAVRSSSSTALCTDRSCGALAQRYGIVPWQPGETIAAAGKCFIDWLRARGGHDAAEVRDGIEQIRSLPARQRNVTLHPGLGGNAV